VKVEVYPERERAELETYLGERYDHSRLQQWEAVLEEEFAQVGDEQKLYRTSEAYLYNLTAFAMTATKLPYLEEVVRVTPPGGRVLDYGCGIGSDGLTLAELGFQVEFADFDNPSTRYLRWRLDRRNIEAKVHDLDAGGPPEGFDTAFAFDVIEHVDDPHAFLAELEQRATIVVVNLLEPVPGETALHRELPIPSLLQRAERGRVLRYRIHHERSHLMTYTPHRKRGWLRRRG
jgi:cyclopropane fatty-acyl-phospholipid synthase-like methyltransferase